ncbi:LysM peptidoglycan-binding domain-containing protein [Aliiglaciecola sp. CAU 1673]|uniref:LysM peptidoglycan-binding domain-containing protein n=1 Tax=Aliiglaciecola sp. CAU 1673 TaxID=3032595 RepID=UPI0023DA467B|nr:LysM peptidoglycan-binding domain-containing protein [Aliiglaciecola sp. CAU 1673]MDF2180267.1 LysM peptidoglycan-binding domain-containing protein [Aliiglaciecola sp. CAU 1673]
MKKTILLLSLLSLQACVTTDKLFGNDPHQDNEHRIAAEILEACQTGEYQGEECAMADTGVIPVTHPEVEPDYPLDTSAEDASDQVSNLWLQIRDQLFLEIPDDKRVLEQQNWYLSNPAYMDRVSLRAAPFLYLIVEEIEKRQMPMELVLLPIVESAFDPFAYSHGRAAGMWQFIPGTAKRFGLKQSWWYDGRRDVIASTNAALDYLEYLNKMFDGNWLHALAAYNSGEGRVQSAIRTNKRKGKPTDFWSLDLPKETRAYVPKLLALANIVKHDDEFMANISPIEAQPVTQLVDVGSQIDLALAAELAKLTLEELHSLNPGYNRWATDPKGPHGLLLPVDRVDTFKSALEEIDNSKRLNWVRHQVKSGDSLLELAEQYHTTPDAIQLVNKLKGNTIIAGEYLLIPVALKALDEYALSVEERLEDIQSKPRANHRITHIVEPGDTLWDLSVKYNIRYKDLAKWNGMAPNDPLKPGKKLVVWVDELSGDQEVMTVMRTVTYTVRNGDSLARIAGRFNVSIQDIERWNKLTRENYLQPGQKLKLHVDVTKS